MKNKLISIGWLGIKRCYLNVSREEAIKRYVEEAENSILDDIDEHYLVRNDLIEEFDFDDEFSAYDVGEK